MSLAPEPALWRPSLRAPLLADPVLGATGILLALSLAPTLAAMALDPRLFQGESIWLKPVKFQIALALYALTLAVYARWLPEGLTRRRGFRLFRAVVVFSILAELLWIGGAAMFGTASHFNVATPVMASLYAAMGLFAVTLTSASLVYGVAIWRNAASPLPAPMRLAIGLGLVLTFGLTVPVAGTLSSMAGHFVGTPVTHAAVPILGWSREVGDLRLPHFLATHAMHAIPLAGLAAGALLADGPARGAVWAAGVIFVLAVAATFNQALAGLPLFAA